MTKQKMIKAIQRYEAALYLEVKQAEQRYGVESDITARRTTRWASVHDAMQAMGVACDLMLPDNQKALAIKIEMYA
jgi:hypothetical protein